MNKFEELKLDLIEIEAYRRLNKETFDFGHGEIENNSSVSEDEYYRMEQAAINELYYDDYDDIIKLIRQKKRISTTRHNRYLCKLKSYQRLKQLQDYAWHITYYDEDKKRYVRCYGGMKPKRDAKQASRRRVRNRMKHLEFTFKGNEYRRLYDYWWELW
jgi:hypothetical protein